MKSNKVKRKQRRLFNEAILSRQLVWQAQKAIFSGQIKGVMALWLICITPSVGAGCLPANATNEKYIVCTPMQDEPLAVYRLPGDRLQVDIVSACPPSPTLFATAGITIPGNSITVTNKAPFLFKAMNLSENSAGIVMGNAVSAATNTFINEKDQHVILVSPGLYFQLPTFFAKTRLYIKNRARQI